MKTIAFYFLLISFLGGTLVLVDSCKKEKEQDYPEADFIKELKRGWYVSYYEDIINESFFSYSYDGDSIVYYRNEGYYVGDTFICSLTGIENLQTWTFTESNNQYHLKTEDVCGGVNNYTFNYTNYQSFQQLLVPDIYVNYADVKLVGQDTIISFFRFTHIVNITKPFSSDIEILFEEDHKPRCILEPEDF